MRNLISLLVPVCTIMLPVIEFHLVDCYSEVIPGLMMKLPL